MTHYDWLREKSKKGFLPMFACGLTIAFIVETSDPLWKTVGGFCFFLFVISFIYLLRQLRCPKCAAPISGVFFNFSVSSKDNDGFLKYRHKLNFCRNCRFDLRTECDH